MQQSNMGFDDVVSDNNGESAWTQVCEKHSKPVEREYKGALEGLCSECICGVKGCDTQAEYYFTFYTQEAR